MNKLIKGYSSCSRGESRLSPNGIQMNSGDGSLQGGHLAGGLLDTGLLCVVMWNHTTHWWHYGNIVCRSLPLENSSAGRFSSQLVDSLWRRSRLQRWRSICSLDLSQPQHVAAYFVHLLPWFFFFFFGTASQFPSNPTDATTCFIFMQTTAELSKDSVLNGVFF